MRVIARVPDHHVDLRPRLVRLVFRGPAATALAVGLAGLVVMAVAKWPPASEREAVGRGQPSNAEVAAANGEVAAARAARVVTPKAAVREAACAALVTVVQVLECERERYERPAVRGVSPQLARR